MSVMMQTIHTPTFTETAEAVSGPCRRLPVNDGDRLGSAVSLAERCVH
jgi:hypothetical protein